MYNAVPTSEANELVKIALDCATRLANHLQVPRPY
jgi:hypothetical protein